MGFAKFVSLFGVLIFHTANSTWQEDFFDDPGVCPWSPVTQHLLCPVMNQQGSPTIMPGEATRHEWKGGDDCEGSYCLYYNEGFAGGRGIAVITLPDQMNELRKVDDRLQEASNGCSFNNENNVNFHLEDAEIGGKWAISDKALGRGHPLMAHPPVLLVHNGFMEHFDTSPTVYPRDFAVHVRFCNIHLPQDMRRQFSGFSGCRSLYSLERQHHLLQLGVDSLPPETASLYKALISEDSSISRTITTSGIGLRFGGHYYLAAYPEAARLAHDCRPNTAYYIDPDTLMHTTTVARFIQPGESITISQLASADSEHRMGKWDQRQRRARHVWGKDCTCSQCSLSPQDIADSDKRIEGIGWSLYMAISMYEEFKRGDSYDLHSVEETATFADVFTDMIKMHEDERLEFMMAAAYRYAALNANMLGRAELAEEYAGLAIEAFRIEAGNDNEAIREMQNLRANPKGHATFRLQGKA